jgi:hypothetical protein
MKPLHAAVAALVLVVAATVATAERPPQKRAEADLVATGKVEKITTKTSKFGNDGEMTTYVAKVVIDKVEKGKDAKDGDTVEVTWFRVTKNPSKPLPGAYGHKFDLKTDDKARFWLMKGKDVWSVIYNSDGVEKLKK